MATSAQKQEIVDLLNQAKTKAQSLVDDVTSLIAAIDQAITEAESLPVEHQPPSAVMDLPTSPVAEQNLQFVGSSSIDPESDTLTYAWFFGDGGSSLEADPIYQYAVDGTYTVSLTVTSSVSGLSDTTSNSLVVNPAPSGFVPGAIPDVSNDPDAIIVNSGDTLTVNGELRFTTLHVKPNGTLDLQPGARLVKIAGVPDLSIDPEQITHGVINEGSVTAPSDNKTPFIRLTSGLLASATTMTLESSPINWNVGDEIVIAGSEQKRIDSGKTRSHNPTSEIVTITAINGADVAFTPALNHVHPQRTIFDQAGNVVETYKPHVGIITHHIRVESEDPTQPGHWIQLAGSSFDLAGVEFRSFGRTKATEFLDSTVIDSDTGHVLHYGTNQIARYPFHCHHMRDATGNRIVECSFVNNRKWGPTIHATDNVICQHNVVVRTDGAGIMLEDGSELGNVVTHNLITDCGNSDRSNKTGGASRRNTEFGEVVDTGFMGDGIWSRGQANTISDNVCADCFFAGVNINGYYESDNSIFATNKVDPPDSERNECYSCRMALWVTWPQGTGQAVLDNQKLSVFRDYVGWHLNERGIEIYHTNRHLLTGWKLHNDPVGSSNNDGKDGSPHVRQNVAYHLGNATYQTGEIDCQNCEATGWNIGLWLPINVYTAGWFNWSGGMLRCFTNVMISPAIDHQPRIATIQGVDFQEATDMTPPEAWAAGMPQLPLDFWCSEIFYTLVEGNKSDVQVPDYATVPSTIYFSNDVNSPCAATHPKIRDGVICEV